MIASFTTRTGAPIGPGIPNTRRVTAFWTPAMPPIAPANSDQARRESARTSPAGASGIATGSNVTVTLTARQCPESRSEIALMRRPAALIVLALLAVLVLAACGSSKKASTTAATATTAANACQKASLALVQSGRLTVATDKPAFPPYFENNDPTNGKGFESAVAYAIAGKLGFAKSQVKWVTVPFNASFAPGPKKFDFDVNEISITKPRQKAVDFSAPYFTAPQAVVALSKSSAARATSLAGLGKAKLGVQIGTTSLDAVKQVIKPSQQPQIFNNSNDVISALKTGRVDAVVVDLPTAFYVTAAQVKGSKIVGQFKAPGGDPWGALLARGSKLTPCVSKAVTALRAGKALDLLQARWMGGQAGAPELR